MNSLMRHEYIVIYLLLRSCVNVDCRIYTRVLGSKTRFPNHLKEIETKNGSLSSIRKDLCAKYRSSVHVPPYCKRSQVRSNFRSERSITNISSSNSTKNPSSSSDRIVNGYDVALKNHPWVVSLEIVEADRRISLCGGTIIADDTILTAGHCVDRRCEGTVYSSDVHKFRGSKYNFECRTDRIFIHPWHDIALIKVSEKINGVPLSMPTGPEEAPKAGDEIFVLGWGRVCNVWGKPCEKQDFNADVLQGVTLEVTGDCVADSFCAGGFDENGYPRDACAGDSGTTVECKDEKDSVYLCGVVSSGPKPPDCGKSAGILASVANKEVLEWIKRYTTYKTTPRRKHVWEKSNQSDRLAPVADLRSILGFLSLLPVFLI